MTGVTTGIVVGLTAFLMGTLSMHWLADHLLLWQSPITHESLISAHAYYSNTVVSMQSPFNYILHAGWILAASIVLSKILGGRRESNWLFDGASLFLYIAAGVVYFGRIRQNLNVLPPLTPAPSADPQNPADPTFVPLRELATSNAVLAVALVGVMILQSGQFYSERLEERERIEETEARLTRRRRKLNELNKR
ncbi:unnamed protein product [Sympodiomycopsis kandeliae]